MKIETKPRMSEPSNISSGTINPAEVAAVAHGMADVVRQVGVRWGCGAALCEASGCIMAAAVFLTDACGAAATRDIMAWHGERAAVPLGPEAHMPISLADDGLELPEPRTIGASSHHVVRSLRAIAQERGDGAALEVACGVLRAGIAVVRELTDICSGAQSNCGGRAIKGRSRRTLAETGAPRRRTFRETGRTIGETDARSSGSTHAA